jgi:protein-S-isoprenylcysteine O-methyltransferase Ste14
VHTLRLAIAAVWIAFWLYWLLAAAGAKQSVGRRRTRICGLTVALPIFVILRLLGGGSLAVHSPVLAGVGAALVAAGLALAVWARIYLGGNWGMPMTRRAEPELVTSGPYRLVRHPIYSGLLLGVLGTTLAKNLFGLVFVVAVGAFFIYSARVEERNLATSFPSTYPAYKSATKMLIPFVL